LKIVAPATITIRNAKAINKMRIEDLPIKFMNVEISSPRQDLLDRLEGLQVTKYILKNYQSLEDRAACI
jgi:hypothetical protein